jgi:UDP-glucose 4-epimerase
MKDSSIILVCGGAGYIGSHMCKRLARAGLRPLVFDNLATGHAEAVRWGELVVGDLLDRDALARVFRDHRIAGVMHFAARSLVAESVREPATYFRNNVGGTLNLLDAMREAAVDRLVFSSTAAVYGLPRCVPIDESHPLQPINPYGWSKLFAERVIEEYARAYGLRAVCFRYFNACGADADGELGEDHEPETHLLPNLARAAVDRAAPPVVLFGNDHDTPDGTCVRDFVHVEDLCDAHLLGWHLLEDPGVHVFNLGTETGHSVAQALQACRALCEGRPEAEWRGRREGDPATLVASARAFREATGWRPTRSFEESLRHTLAWARRKRA